MTIQYVVTKQEIDSLKSYAMYIRHFNTAIGILLGTFITLVLGLICDETYLEVKVIVCCTMFVFLMWFFLLKLETQSKIEKVWECIKKDV
ncbi:hypothetical protein BWD162_005450 [Bartonella sp. WD16.2]|nr:hypothetical protein BWD162_005450 [Bartonella sp. WD16.2]